MFSNDPVICSVYAIVITFLVVGALAYYYKIDMVSERDEAGNNKVVVSKLVSYSAMVAVLVGIVVLLVCSLNKGKMAGMGFGSSGSYKKKFSYY